MFLRGDFDLPKKASIPLGLLGILRSRKPFKIRWENKAEFNEKRGKVSENLPKPFINTMFPRGDFDLLKKQIFH